MLKVIGLLFGIWCVVVLALFLMTTVSHSMNEIVSTAADEIAASGNMTEIVGIENAWRSFPVWKWFLPPLVGLIATGVVLYQNRSEVWPNKYG